MDNNILPKNHQKSTLGNLNRVEDLDLRKKPEKTHEEEISSKQATHNRSNSQNKFDLPSFKCIACPYESIWKHAVKRHQQIHLKEQNVPEGVKKQKYKCETCSYTTNNRAALKNHQKLHKTIDTKLSTDIEQNSLSMNIIEHLEEDKYKEQESIYTCKSCEYKTSYKDEFESHKKVQHQNKGEEIFLCDHCSFNSVYRQSFLRHMKNMHGNYLNSVLHCVYCGTTSVCKEQFVEHMKMHEGEKNMEENLHYCGNKNIYSLQERTDLNEDCDRDIRNQNNNVPHQNQKSQEIILDSLQNKLPVVSKIQKPLARQRRGKYSDVPVKTTKNGLFECEHCSYQTAIRTALVKHQTNHLKSANS